MEKPEFYGRIGGQAIMEGVMMRGPHSMAMAVRDPDGEIQLETKRLSGPKWYSKVPILRGIISFFVSLVSGMKCLMRSSEVCYPDDETLSKGGTAFAVILGILLAVGIFILIPEGIVEILNRFVYSGLKESVRILLNSLIAGVLRILIFVLYLFFVSKMKEIKRTFMYHGAEHRTINCYESGLPLNVENIQTCSTRHNRCGTTFLFIVMIISILLFALVNWLVVVIGFQNNVWLRMGLKILLLPIVAGLSYEILKLLAKLPDNGFVKALRAPGLALQGLTTRKPEDDMAEAALISFNAVLKMETDPEVKEVKFFEHDYTELRRFIDESLAPTDADASETDWIICHVTGLKRNQLRLLKTVADKDYKRIKEIVARRVGGEPLDYILGQKQFYNKTIKVTSAVLIPRPETELLCEKALAEIGDGSPEVLDLCTGSGCIAAVLSDTAAVITASDISEDALKVAAENVPESVRLVQSDLFGNIEGQFDLIVCNPPYVSAAEMEELSPSVKAEPESALYGGTDGLDFYRRLSAESLGHLKKGGVLLMEIGFSQAESVKALFEKDFVTEVFKDLSGCDRIVRAEKKFKK